MKKLDERFVSSLRQQFEVLSANLDERGLRLWAGGVATSLGWGGVSRVAEVTGMSHLTIKRGAREATEQGDLPKEKRGSSRLRREGGGRKPATTTNSQLQVALEKLLNSSTRGDPVSPLLWVSKSTRNLAAQLEKKGFSVTHQTIWKILREMGYSLQRNQKNMEGAQHADRDAQFQFISRKSARFMSDGNPVISIDTKKKEKIGPYKNEGQEWHSKGKAEKVKTHDFIDRDLGKVSPYGVYDIYNNTGWVSVGIDHDTAQFSVASIRTWWLKMGKKSFSDSSNLYITADSGGSNSSRGRLWKTSLQAFATEFQMTVHVSHFPPGTSKWNKVEHRLFCHITANWRNRPLTSREIVVNLIANTSTKSGLRVKAKLDTHRYPKGIVVSDDEFSTLHIRRGKFHGDWNYIIKPG